MDNTIPPPRHEAAFGTPRVSGPVPSPPPGWSGWEGLMELALTAAGQAAAEGEVPVGAVLVDAHGRIVGTGRNRCIALSDPSAHAEVEALRMAGRETGNYRLEGCVLVCTLEPCLMCAGALVHARISGLVYGATDLRAGAVSSQLEGLDQPFHNHGVWHLPGVLAGECAALLREFFQGRRGGQPF